MNNRKVLVVANSLLLLFVFLNVLTWALAGSGVNYLSKLSDSSRYVFYALLVVSIVYSISIGCLLAASKRKGLELAVVWNIFLGLFILIPLIGGHASLSHGGQADIGFFSVSNLLKAGVGVALIVFGWAFKNQRDRL